MPRRAVPRSHGSAAVSPTTIKNVPKATQRQRRRARLRTGDVISVARPFALDGTGVVPAQLLDSAGDFAPGCEKSGSFYPKTGKSTNSRSRPVPAVTTKTPILTRPNVATACEIWHCSRATSSLRTKKPRRSIERGVRELGDASRCYIRMETRSRRADQAKAGRMPMRWAWGLCWLMFASTVLNYMDRQTITLVKDQIEAAFSIKSDVDFGWVLAAFSMTYALFQVPAGYLVDRWDLRWSYAAAVAWWSLAAMAIALVPSLGMLIVCRASWESVNHLTGRARCA